MGPSASAEIHFSCVLVILKDFRCTSINKQTNKKKTISSFVFQDPESQTPGQSVQLGRAAPHARQTEERDGGEQSGPEQGRLQKEPGRLHPARPCKLTRASLSQTNCWMWDVGETKENSVCVDKLTHQNLKVSFLKVCLFWFWTELLSVYSNLQLEDVHFYRFLYWCRVILYALSVYY